MREWMGMMNGGGRQKGGGPEMNSLPLPVSILPSHTLPSLSFTIHPALHHCFSPYSSLLKSPAVGYIIPNVGGGEEAGRERDGGEEGARGVAGRITLDTTLSSERQGCCISKTSGNF